MALSPLLHDAPVSVVSPGTQSPLNMVQGVLLEKTTALLAPVCRPPDIHCLGSISI